MRESWTCGTSDFRVGRQVRVRHEIPGTLLGRGLTGEVAEMTVVPDDPEVIRVLLEDGSELLYFREHLALED